MSQAIFARQFGSRLEASRALALPRYGYGAAEAEMVSSSLGFETALEQELMYVVSTLSTRSEQLRRAGAQPVRRTVLLGSLPGARGDRVLSDGSSAVEAVEARDLWRIPLWVGLKLAYTLLPMPILFPLARVKGLATYRLSRNRHRALGRLTESFGGDEVARGDPPDCAPSLPVPRGGVGGEVLAGAEGLRRS